MHHLYNKSKYFLLYFLFSTFSVLAQSGEILLDIKKLNTFANVLYIAAHPDDENTRLLSYLANEKCFSTAYLSITRGDGGQNLIGKEQGDKLGIIRTQELLAARKIDGAEQFFTRAVDFGYSKNPEETFALWGKEDVLADVVWVIRTFKPDLIITRFPDDGGGGHGHHTASAILAKEAFIAAADKNRFKEQLKFTEVWQAKGLFWNTFSLNRMKEEETKNLVKLDIGGFNPLLGKSYGEIAALSRSQHKSQGFGVSNARGELIEYFKQWGGEPVKENIFEHIQSNWNRLKGSEKAASLANKLVERFNPLQPEKLTLDLVLIYKALKELPPSYFQEQKLKQVENLLLKANGVHLEFLCKNFSAIPLEQVEAEIYAINRSQNNIKLNWIKPNLLKDTLKIEEALYKNNLRNDKFEFSFPKSNIYTSPFWLQEKKEGNLFAIAKFHLRAQAENSAEVFADIGLSIEGINLIINRKAIYKWVDPVKGELIRNFEILPEIEASSKDKMVIFSESEIKTIQLNLKSKGEQAKITIVPNVPAGWQISPTKIEVDLTTNLNQQIEFSLTPSVTTPVSQVELTFTIISDKQNQILKSVSRIDYDHIPMQTITENFNIKLVKAKFNTNGHKIGYIEGAGDDIPQVLKDMGYQVEKLDLKTVMNDKLSEYKAIITGIRAYNMNEDLAAMQPILLNYVNNGGKLIVQYNTKNWLSDLKVEPTPYKIELSRERVTDENAVVRILNPAHPALNTPNKISVLEFSNWIQERGLYFPSSWDTAFEPLLEMNDPGENAQKGSLLTANFGKGKVVYTGLSFFRQLPAGVPGAITLFNNLIEY